MASIVAVGVGLAAIGVLGKYAIKYGKVAQNAINKKFVYSASNYYKGGFEPTMTPKEASLILGISASAEQRAIGKAAIKISRFNHPDIGYMNIIDCDIDNIC